MAKYPKHMDAIVVFEKGGTVGNLRHRWWDNNNRCGGGGGGERAATDID